MFLQTIIYNLTSLISLGMVIAFQERPQIDCRVEESGPDTRQTIDTLVKMPL